MKSVHERSDIRLNIFGLAVVIALLWHIFWWSWLKPAVGRPAAPAGSVTKMTYLPLTQDAAGDPDRDLYTLWKPMILGLPSPFGFSGPLLTQRAHIEPPLDAPGESVNLLERVENTNESRIVQLMDLKKMARDQMSRLPPAASISPAYGGPDEPGRNPVGLVFGPGVLQEDFLNTGLPDVAEWGEAPWEVEAWLESGDRGDIARVLLEKPGPDAAINARLIRHLYLWRLREADAQRSGRVRITYRGRASTPPPPGAELE